MTITRSSVFKKKK